MFCWRSYPSGPVMWLTALTLAILSLGVGGCETAGNDLVEAIGLKNPTPTQAASWMFDTNPEKRRRGISLISNAYFGGEDVYVKVYREAVNDNDPMVRAAAVHALGLHGTGEDALLIAPLLRDEHELTRWESAKALQRLHHADVVTAIMDALARDESLDVRLAAAAALGQYPEHRVLESLIGGLNDDSLAVNFNARRSLRILTGQDFGTDPEVWREWYRRTESPFAEGGEYLFPVYRRNMSLLERWTPFVRPSFEEPGRPVGTAEHQDTEDNDSSSS